MLPSRSLSIKVDGMAADDGFQSGSLKYRSIRENKLRRRKSLHNAAFRRGSMLDADDDVFQDTLDAGTLREVPTSLRQKRSIRAQASSLDRKKLRKPGWIKRSKYAISMALRHLKMRIAAVTYSLGFWNGHIKTVEGNFGTGVASYFIFLRVLFLLNLPLFVLSLSFIVVPQLLYRFLQKSPSGYTENSEFSGVEILTGGGWLEDTVMYYGYYLNGTINIFSAHHNGSYLNLSGLSYNMQYAYLLTCAGFYLLCMIILGHRTAKSYRKNYVDSSGEIHERFIVKILTGWNYTIINKNTAVLKQKCLYKEMTEYLATQQHSDHHNSCGTWCRLILIRIIANIVVLGLIGGSAFLIWYIYVSQSLKTDLKVLREMALPLTISAFNVVMPVAFSMIGAIEKYGKPRVQLYLALVRTMLMKGVTLGVLIYFWFVKLNCHHQEGQCIACWETYMGEEIYRLVLVDFLTSVIMIIFFMEFIRRLLAQHCCKFLGKPEFDIGCNTLDLIYSQALCWLGAFYCPMLSLIQLVKLFILFYMKKVSLMMNCAPSQKPWRAARTNTVFLGFLFSAFLMTSVAVAMNIIVIKPSTSCGPFRGLNSTYDIITDLVDDWRGRYPALSAIIKFFTSEGAVSGLIITLICLVYYLRIMAIGRQELVQFLLYQVRLEGRDKNFLLRKFQQIQTQQIRPKRFQPAKPAIRRRVEIDAESSASSSSEPPRPPVVLTTPPTPHSVVTPSSDSLLPLTDCSDGVTPYTPTPESVTPYSPTSDSVTPSSTLALTPESDEITAKDLTAGEEPAPDYDTTEQIELTELTNKPTDDTGSDHEDYMSMWELQSKQ